MPAKQTISMFDLRPGDRVELLFHGSKQLGNDPWSETCTFEQFETDPATGELHANFDGGWGAYRINNRGRWRYGSSAELLSILRRL